VNCNTDVRVCLDLKSVGLLLREQKKLKTANIVNNSVLKKPAKLLRKRCISNSTTVSNSAKVSLDTGKKRSKSEMAAMERKTSEATAPIQNSQKRKYKKRKVAKGKELACQTLCKKPGSSARERNEDCSNSETAVKSGSKRKESKNLSTLLVGDLKKKIASKKLLNKTKVIGFLLIYKFIKLIC